jgi:hypothetical protein
LLRIEERNFFNVTKASTKILPPLSYLLKDKMPSSKISKDVSSQHAYMLKVLANSTNHEKHM